MFLELLFLVGLGTGAWRADRRSGQVDGRPSGPGQRRRLVLGGDRSANRRIPRKLSAGARASVVDRCRSLRRLGDQRRTAPLARRRIEAFVMRVVWSAIVAGLMATLLLSTILGAAAELAITRMDIPFLLGTSVTD